MTDRRNIAAAGIATLAGAGPLALNTAEGLTSTNIREREQPLAR
jgi:hypothetical protein